MVTRQTAPGLLKPEQVGPLVIEPLQRDSLALNPAVSTTVLTDASSYKLPKITGDPAAGWVNEASPLPLGDLAVDELDVYPQKLACLVPASSELVEDSQEDVLDVLGAALVRDAGSKLDTAFLSNLPAPAPSGLAALAAASGSGVQKIVAGSDWPKNLDFAAEASAAIENVGGTLTAVIVNPDDALAIAKIRTATGSNQTLLAAGGDPSRPSRRQVEGVELIPHAACPAGVAWAVDGTRNFTVIRRQIKIVTDRSVFLTTDRVAVVMTMRAAFGFADERTVVRISRS